MSHKVEIIDEYSFGQWFSDRLRFATEAEATEYSHHFSGAGWNGLLDLRVVQSDDSVNDRWTENGISDKDGQPLYGTSPPPTPQEVREEAKKLAAGWDAIVDRMDSSLKRPQKKD